MTDNNTVTLIEQRLQDAFSPTFLEVIDESHRHAKHKGRDENRGNYVLTIHSQAFADKSPIQRHKMIYAALGELMQTHIHGLAIKAKV
ncbi:MAG: BolA family transcriptional regulator [Gammaproteobacteria bacterium]|nr:BolA family transcriptional regulator [Gammaproteobacteria bacterium]